MAAQAAQHWLAPIQASGFTPGQKLQLLTRLAGHPHLVQDNRPLRRPDLLKAWSEAAGRV